MNRMCCVSELKLSPRELDILRLTGAGYTSRQIARSFHCSRRTVEKHIENAFDKIGACSMANALVLAHQLGLLDVMKIESVSIRKITE